MPRPTRPTRPTHSLRRSPILAAVASLGCVSVSAGAVPIEEVEAGATYEINQVEVDNDVVVVRQIDHERKRVEVQYLNGPARTAWVEPDKLHTPEDARRLDAAEEFLRVLAEVSIEQDPEQRAARLIIASIRLQQNGKLGAPAIDKPPVVPAGLMAPQAPGDWLETQPADIIWAKLVVNQALKPAERVTLRSARKKTLPFYEQEDGQPVFLMEMADDDGGFYHALIPRGARGRHYVLLDSSHQSFDRFHANVKLRLTSPELVEDYLKFFCSTISSLRGAFHIIDPNATHLDPALLDRLNVQPMQTTLLDNGSYAVTAHLIYDDHLFLADFRVDPDGRVTMTEDKKLSKVQTTHRYEVNGYRRTLAPNP
ncbi:MAG: hypothetical protein AAF797_09595 [Planctomycetota bacterium]